MRKWLTRTLIGLFVLALLILVAIYSFDRSAEIFVVDEIAKLHDCSDQGCNNILPGEPFYIVREIRWKLQIAEWIVFDKRQERVWEWDNGLILQSSNSNWRESAMQECNRYTQFSTQPILIVQKDMEILDIVASCGSLMAKARGGIWVLDYDEQGLQLKLKGR